jgi:transposase-like protein
MIISRVKAGLFMIGGSIILFVTAVILIDESQAVTKVAALTPWQNLLAILSIVLMIVGVYFVLSSKTCPVCREKVRRAEPECKYCGYNFKPESRR